jgi:hypothetical protein
MKYLRGRIWTISFIFSEIIDDFRNGDNISYFSKVAIMVTIEEAVKKLLNTTKGIRTSHRYTPNGP